MTPDANSFTHLDDAGTPRMVDITEKTVSARSATVRARIWFPTEVMAALNDGGWNAPKGPVLHTAVIAGTQAVKKTPDLIPFCHPLPIEGCKFEHRIEGNELEIRCRVKITHKTGVEMEAFTGATVAALTVIDMCKALSHEIEIRDVVLLQKQGGKRDVQRAPELRGLALAGGMSKRMGSDKALMAYHGEPQVLHVFRLLQDCTEDAWVSCREGQLPFEVPQLHDRKVGRGPMEGMLRAFERSPNSAWLVVACDLPLLTPQVLSHLVTHRNPKKLATAYRAKGNGLPEPLCAIYEPEMADVLREWAEAERRCPRKILITLEDQVELLDLPDADALDNANAPEDLKRLKEKFS